MGSQAAWMRGWKSKELWSQTKTKVRVSLGFKSKLNF